MNLLIVFLDFLAAGLTLLLSTLAILGLLGVMEDTLYEVILIACIYVAIISFERIIKLIKKHILSE